MSRSFAKFTLIRVIINSSLIAIFRYVTWFPAFKEMLPISLGNRALSRIVTWVIANKTSVLPFFSYKKTMIRPKSVLNIGTMLGFWMRLHNHLFAYFILYKYVYIYGLDLHRNQFPTQLLSLNLWLPVRCLVDLLLHALLIPF